MSTILTPTATKTLSAKAFNDELARRKNNRKRRAKGEPVSRAKSYVLPAMTTSQIAAALRGELVTVTFKSGRIEIVGLSS